MWQESKHLCSLLCSQIQTLALLSVSRCFMSIKSKLRVKLEMTSAVWGREKEAWRAAESWRVKSYGLPSHSHLSKPVQQAEMGISESSYANFKYWISIILWLHQKIPPAIYIRPSLRKTMHLNSHQPTTRDSKVWKKNSFWHLAASGNRKNHGYHHYDQGCPRSPQW